MMNLIPGVDATASALNAEYIRMDVVAENIANAYTTHGADGQPYQRKVVSFEEKPRVEGGLINGGFFVLNPSCLDLVSSDHTVWEKETMEHLAASGQLAAWVHHGFWQPMDTLRDMMSLNALWDSNRAPWKSWP